MLSTQVQSARRLLVVLVIGALLLIGLVIAQIRLGGPMSRANALQDEMLADILPPPAFVVEPYLLATLIADDPAHARDNLARLSALRGEFLARKAYWRGASVPDELRPALDETLHRADRFWAVIDRDFLPALARQDRAALSTLQQGALTAAYQAQNAQVLALVDLSKDYRAASDRRHGIILGFALLIVALLSSAVIIAIVRASGFVQNRIILPVTYAAETMRVMAAGDFEATMHDYLDRSDEIGMMAEATEGFRAEGLAKRQAEQEREVVVESLSVGLAYLARRDLEHKITEAFPSAYEELRRNYNCAVDGLAEAMRAVRVGASSVMRSLSELSTASNDLASRNERQATSLAETASTMDELSGDVRHTARSAATAQNSVTVACEKVDQGEAVVASAIGAMGAIEHSSRQIAAIVELIDGIAFQTNLLALNAGVEAARAGNAGAGFAVVANEVRALAQRSTEAASSVRQLIDAGSEHVGRGVELVGQTGARLGEIEEQMASIRNLVAVIAESADRQAGNLQQLTQATHLMDQMTQQNAAMVEESTAATASLANEATALKELVSTFRTRNVDTRPLSGAGLRNERRDTLAEPATSADSAYALAS
jgi:methyl-accepting chemotaxis protein